MTPERLPRLVLTTLCLKLLLLPGISHAGDGQVTFRPAASGFEILRDRQVIATVPLAGGAVYDLLRLGNTLYVARGESGVSVYDVSAPEQPVAIRTFKPGRQAVRLVAVGTTLVVIVADYSATAYDVRDPARPVATRLEPVLAGLGQPRPSAPSASQPSAPATPAPRPPSRPRPPPPPLPRQAARVVGMRGGWLYLRSPVSLKRGDRFQIRSRRTVVRPDPATGAPRDVPSNRALGYFVVEQVRGGVGTGRLTRGTRAAVGDLAQPTERAPERNPLFPRQWQGMSRLLLTLRPFLPIKELGLGLLSELSLQHYFDFPLKVGLDLAPLGFLAIAGGTGVIGECRGWLAFSHDYFEIGVAPGLQFQSLDDSTHFLAAYAVRIGSLDGLNFEFQNSYAVVKEGGKNQFRFQSAGGELNIPVHPRVILTIEGGGGRTFAFGAGGLKSYLRGGGGPGTIILRTSVGGAYLKDERPVDPRDPAAPAAVVSGGGPALSFGVDARF